MRLHQFFVDNRFPKLVNLGQEDNPSIFEHGRVQLPVFRHKLYVTAFIFCTVQRML